MIYIKNEALRRLLHLETPYACPVSYTHLKSISKLVAGVNAELDTKVSAAITTAASARCV